MNCSPSPSKGICVESPGSAKLTISHNYDGSNTDVSCYEVKWVSQLTDDKDSAPWPKDCFSLTNGHWYGGPEVSHQRWPIRHSSYDMQPYVSNDLYEHRELFGSFVERYFLNSNGLAIVVDDASPLWLSINEKNDGNMCMMAKYSETAFHGVGKPEIELKYNVCIGPNVKVVHQHAMGIFFRRPSAIPDRGMLTYPVWSTWAEYKTNVSQKHVSEYANKIHELGFSRSQLEIDDRWSPEYGDLTFDLIKFPDPRGMMEHLRKLGFRTTLWTTPFIATHSENMRKRTNITVLDNDEDRARAEVMGKRMIRDATGDVPALTRWWNGYAGMWDFTNPEAADWFVQQHEEMRSMYRVDSFKFDAGEAQFLPPIRHTHVRLDNPSFYSKYYAEAVSKLGGLVEVRAGYKTQHLPIFVRMMDKVSTWSSENGLKTMIPTCLLFGIVGYPFVLPDMIGGNAYGNEVPDEELYIRWLQVNTFMPAMQFSVAPWKYGSDLAVRLTKKYIDLHAEYVAPLIVRYAEIATQEDGAPIIRPLWWISPKDEVAFGIEDEFLVGEEVLVAPILEKGARKRDIYLPAAKEWKWKEGASNKVYSGGQWLRDFPVPLEEVPYFRSMAVNMEKQL